MRTDPDYSAMTKAERQKALAQWTRYANIWRDDLTELEAQAVELREQRKPLTDELARQLDEARTFLAKAERQIRRLNEASR